MTIISYETLQGSLVALEFDATTREDHSTTAMVAKHTVETGVSVTDHVIPEGLKLSLGVVISNTPIRPAGVLAAAGSPKPLTLRYVTQKMQSPAQIYEGTVSPIQLNGFPRLFTPGSASPATYVDVTNEVTGSSLQFDEFINRVVGFYQILQQICQEGRKVNVTTSLQYYESMLITEVTTPRDGTDSVTFSLSLEEFRTASTNKVIVQRKQPKPAETRAVPKKDEGKKAIPWGDNDVALRQSVARVLINQKLGLQ